MKKLIVCYVLCSSSLAMSFSIMPFLNYIEQSFESIFLQPLETSVVANVLSIDFDGYEKNHETLKQSAADQLRLLGTGVKEKDRDWAIFLFATLCNDQVYRSVLQNIQKDSRISQQARVFYQFHLKNNRMNLRSYFLRSSFRHLKRPLFSVEIIVDGAEKSWEEQQNLIRSYEIVFFDRLREHLEVCGVSDLVSILNDVQAQSFTLETFNLVPSDLVFSSTERS